MTQIELDPEDTKLITLARAGRARLDTPNGAAVRDETGRTYAAVDVALPSLRLSALQVAVALAVSGGARGLEAAAVVGDSDPTGGDLAAVADLGGAPVYCADPDGSPRRVLRP